MKKSPFILPLIVLLTSAFSCKRENQTGNRPIMAGQTPSTCCPNNLGDSTITGVITSNIFLQRCKTYKLNGLVYVSNNATITIDEGTRIEGIKKTGSNSGGGLIITKGAKIIAVGSPTCPIVFTSAEASPASGDWRGIVILGSAVTNVPAATTVEGIPGVSGIDATYGGMNDTDNSGVIRFVRIEYAGYGPGTTETGSLTLAGVGTGTAIDYVEAFKSWNDSFEFLGGIGNASHLFSMDAQDDMLDFNNGYQGNVSRVLGVADPTRADESRTNGIECDNNAAGTPATPRTRPSIDHTTIVGVSSQALASTTFTVSLPDGTTMLGSYGSAVLCRRNTQFAITNSVCMGFVAGIVLDGATPSTTPCEYQSGLNVLYNDLVHGFGTPFKVEMMSANCSLFSTPAFFTMAMVDNNGYTSTNPNAGIGLASPFLRPSMSSYFLPVGDARTFSAGAF